MVEQIQEVRSQLWVLGGSTRGQVTQGGHPLCKALPRGAGTSPDLTGLLLRRRWSFRALQRTHPCQIPSPMQAFLIMHKYGGGYSRLCCSRESL